VRVRVALAPAEVPAHATAVILDVLRATTTLTIAFANGARRALPVATPEEAFALRRAMPGALLCGERDGRKVSGFDLGNSPDEYRPEIVSGRSLIFASTNGSQAMLCAQGARRRVLAAFVNAAAVVRALHGEREVVLVCAGKLGRFALEDAGCAGLLVERLVARGARAAGDAAGLARALAPQDEREVRALVEGASHGRYLRRLGAAYARDLERCAELDRVDAAFEL
jgi:2-phosphosulfolactate phosphatase